MSNSIVLSHAGKQHAYHIALAMKELNLLHSFYTSSYIKYKWIQNIIEATGNHFLTRRFQHGLYGKKIHSNWSYELKELIFARLYGKGKRTQHAVFSRDMKFDRYIAKILPDIEAEVFWGFQGSCHMSLQSARKYGKIGICELTIAHLPAAKKILKEEKKLHPEWADSFDNLEFPGEYEKRLAEEPHLATFVISASKFTTSTLLQDNIPEEKIIYLPLGFDSHILSFTEKTRESWQQGPLKVLYTGRITQRKGIKYLLEAVKNFDRNEIELHMYGFIHGSGKALAGYNDFFTLHTPVSQLELFNLYKEFDVMVLPSVFEGFGLVIVEAMAAGLPVITTEHTIGPELIENDKNGYIVPIRDIGSITKALTKIRNKKYDEYIEMCRNARRAVEHYSWNNYRERLNKALIKIQ